MTNKTYMLHFGILIIVLLVAMIPEASATFSFSNYADFKSDGKYGMIDVWNGNLILPDEKIASYTLTDNTDYCITNCEAKGTVILFKDGVIFNDINFKEINLNKDIDIQNQFYIKTGTEEYAIDVPDSYKQICSTSDNGTKNCWQEIASYKKEIRTRDIWKEYNEEELPAGEYVWKIEGKKSPAESIDWIASSGNDVKLSQWAVWNSGMNVGIMAYWNFNNDSATNIPDVVSGKYNMTIRGNCNMADAKVGSGGLGGNGIDCNATNASTMQTLAMPDNMSIAVWIYERKHPAATNKILDFGSVETSGAGNKGTTLVMDGAASGKIDWYGNFWGTGDTEIARETAQITTLTWTFYVIERNASGVFMYKNGVVQTQLNNYTGSLTPVNPVIFLSRSSTFSNYSIDEVGVWNRSLTATEISDMYNGGTGLTYTTSFNSISVSLVNPVNYYNSSLNTVNFTCLGTDETAVLNLTLVINNVDNYTVFNTTANQNLTLNINRTLADGIYNWTCRASDGTGIVEPLTATGYNLTVDSTAPTLTVAYPVNGSTYQYNANLSINYTAADTHRDSCWYVFNGAAKVMLNCSLNSTVLANKGIGMNNFTVYVNDTFGNVNYSEIRFTTNTILAQCNSTLTTPYINFTFLDETTGDRLNATIDSATFTYWIANDTNISAQTLTYSNSTLQTSYAFCAYPNASITVNASILFSSTDTGHVYPQREYSANDLIYTNSMTTKILYLLKSTDGQYVTFQTITQTLSPIENVLVTATRTIGGTPTVMDGGLTDSSGGVTLWLDPLYSHAMSFSKAGYTTYLTSITPTQTSYTITMIQIGSSTNVSTAQSGLYYIIQPADNNLAFNTTYNFNFTINSTTGTFSRFSMMIKNQSGDVVNASTSVAGAGGTLINTFNTTNNQYLTVYVNWTIGGETSYAWKTYVISNLNGTEYSIKYFFTDLKSYVSSGMFGLNDFSITLIIFIIIFVITGFMSYNYGIYSPAAISGIVAGLVGFFDIGLGMLDNVNPIHAIAHFPTVFVGIIFIALLIKEASSY